MKNVFYYLKKFGSLSFDERPFGELDALVLSQAAYLRLDVFLPRDGEPVPVAALADPSYLDELTSNTVTPKRDRRLWLALTASRRFGSAQLVWHDDRLDLDGEEQFSAVTFLFDDFAVVSYRGTDLTLLGWKEDFNLSHLDEIPAQARAARYLAFVAAHTPLDLYVCGHSKGGNLAVFAAVNQLDSLHDRIRGVYNLDGPGFASDIADHPTYARYVHKFHKFVPHGALIGVLLHHTAEVGIVRSDHLGILQHVLYHWHVDRHGYFVYTKQLAIGVALYDAAMKEWASSLTASQKAQFVDDLFFVLGARDGVTLADYVRSPRATLKAARLRRKSLSDESRARFLHTLKGFFHALKVCDRRLRKRRREIRHKAREAKKWLNDLKRHRIL